jgi:hypothetical protein
MAEKPKVAIYWLTACGGCDEAIVDLNEVILTVADAVDIVLWPVALDFKYESIRKMKKGEAGAESHPAFSRRLPETCARQTSANIRR